MNYQKEFILCLAGLEFDLEILICVILWINDYKPAFWILLIMSILGTINKMKRLKELRK